MRTFTAQDVLEKAQEYNVKFIRLQFTDIYGVFKNIAITVEELERALEGCIPFDSSVIEGLRGNKESDIYLIPDPTTFQIFPWRPREGAVARLICDVHSPDNRPFAGCSRWVLKKALKEAGELGYRLQVGAEIEFFLFNLDERGKPTTVTHDRAGYCDLTPVDLGENARRDMVLTLEEMGFDIASSHHEIAPGQHEISIKADDALTMADKIATFKFVVRTIAQRHGLHASFMPKPLPQHAGSGMNLHLSLWKDDKNAFYQQDGRLSLSPLAFAFIAGVIHHARAISAITNPLVNSYKRLVPSDVAPFLAAWSEENRSTSIRVPAHREENTVLALRSPDPTCNPYLAIAVVLKCGLDGVDKGMVPPDKLAERGNGQPKVMPARLPSNLGQALDALEKDDLVAGVLGRRIYNNYLEAKRQEWDKFQSEIHPWELEQYLTYY
ncbi:glutamine synthetase [Desulfohalotomaculum tongense]|uniref:type I glutamate--ammonia ligase n=1 Tax=Desulforadius tongensis TaxID=1216062 RepID=UPI001957D5F8|nr:glutamine synthetase [Desulforadius tongensis]